MTIAAPNRPFASDPITGLMLPDGIFVTMLGKQNINLQIENTGATTVVSPRVYVESLSTPTIALTPGTRYLADLHSGASHVEQWEADFRNCPAGNHFISFIVEESSGNKTRLIKKIFVLALSFDANNRTFNAETPEGILTVHFRDLLKPRRGCGGGGQGGDCCCGKGEAESPFPSDRIADDNLEKNKRGINKASYTINNFASFFHGHDARFLFCPPGYLPHRIKLGWTPTPPYPGQYSDLPFQDPWWKIVLCIIAFLLLVASAIAEAVDGSGSVTVGGGSGDTGGPNPDCCGIRAGGGGSSYVAAGLLAAAAAVATAAGMSDVRDPFRRGQDATPPAAGEKTLEEQLEVVLNYPEPVMPGGAFAVAAKWDYTRITTGASYNASANDLTQNVHLSSSYEITAPEFAYTYKKDGEWTISAQFLDQSGKPYKGSQLFVQCFLVGPQGEWLKLLLQDDGIVPDDKPGDGIYTARHYFSIKSRGLWQYYVIAQDVNNANPNLTPEDAAKIIGGMVLTHQLVVTFTEDDCPLIPDGHVMVV